MITWRVPAILVGLGSVALTASAVTSVAPLPVLGGVAGLVALLVALDWAIAAPAGEVTLRRTGPTKIRLGESATVTLSVTNHAVRPMRALIRDAWVPSAGADPPYAHTALIEPGETVAIDTTLTPVRRGERRAVRITIRSYGPLSLAFRQTSNRTGDRITPPWTVRVRPEFRSRKLLPEKLSRLRVVDGMVVTRGRGQGTEFDSLRDYVLGDDPRAIDWRASARQSHVVVKQWRPERDRRVLCVLDTGRTSAGRITGPDGVDAPRLESCIDAALLLAALATHAGDRVDLIAVDTRAQTNVSVTSPRSLPKLLDALASVEPALVETDFGRLTAEVLAAERKRALVVLFTTLDPGAIGDGLLPVLSTLVSRHLLVIATVHDPTLTTLATGRDGPAALHAAAAAAHGLAEGHRVAAALNRAGVHVIEAPADSFASTVADTYLTLKAAGRL